MTDVFDTIDDYFHNWEFIVPVTAPDANHRGFKIPKFPCPHCEGGILIDRIGPNSDEHRVKALALDDENKPIGKPALESRLGTTGLGREQLVSMIAGLTTEVQRLDRELNKKKKRWWQ